MNLKEFVNLKKIPISQLGGTKFNTNITGEEVMNPHKEMNRCLTIYLTRPFVNSGIRQIIKFKKGRNLRFKSENRAVEDFANKWLNNRRWLKNQINNYITLREVCGNSYLEAVYEGNKKLFNGFVTFPDPSRIFINTEFKDINVDYWIVEVPLGIKQINGLSPKYFKINYIFGSALWQNTVYGIPYGKKKFDVDKVGMSINGLYGRSYMASIIDDEEAMKQIIKNISIIAKYRAMNNKIIYPAGEEEVLVEDDRDQIVDDLLMMKDGEHLVWNKKVQIDSLNNQGEYDTMNQETDFLRRDMQSGLTPNFVTPWNADVNRSTAAEAKIPFEMEIEDDREEIMNFLSDFFIKGLKMSYPQEMKDSKGLKLTSDPVRLDGKDELMQWGRDFYNEGLITFNEARKLARFDTVKGGDMYNWQIQAEEGTVFNPTKSSIKEEDTLEAQETFKEGASKLTLQKFMKLYSDKYGTGDCRKAANKVLDRVEGYKLRALPYEPGLGEPLGAAGVHYVAESSDGKTIIDLTFPYYAQKLIYGRRATSWVRSNKTKQIFRRTEYMKNIYVDV